MLLPPPPKRSLLHELAFVLAFVLVFVPPPSAPVPATDTDADNDDADDVDDADDLASTARASLH